MKRFTNRIRRSAVFTTVLCLVQMLMSAALQAQSPVRIQQLVTRLDMTAMPGPVPLTFEGVASHLGKLTGSGEVSFAQGPVPDSLSGTGVSVFRAANGDLLAGSVTISIGPLSQGIRDVRMQFAWRDSVTFSNGSLVANTGRFVSHRPPGLVIDDKSADIPLIVRIIIIVFRR